MPKIFALRDRLMEVQQSLTNDDVDVRSKRVVDDDDVVKFDDFNDPTTKHFGLQIFESIFNRKVSGSTSCWPQHQSQSEPALVIEGKIAEV